MTKYFLVALGKEDSWGRTLYQDLRTGLYFCDTLLLPEYHENAAVTFKGRDIEGEPDFPIEKEKYQFIKVLNKQKIRGFEAVSSCKEAKLPKRSTSKSAGYDFFAFEEGIVPPGEKKWFRTGIKAYMQEDEVLLCYPRSSLGFKNGIRLSNGTGVIDHDYYNNDKNEGEIQVSLHNTSDKEFVINKGDKIFQAVFTKYLIADDDEPLNKKRKGGIGSTGK